MNELLRDILSQAQSAETPPELAETRRAASSAVEALGLPSVRHEHWKYTNLAPLARHSYRLARRDDANSVTAATIAGLKPASRNARQLVVVNGHVRDDLSSVNGLGSSVRVRSLSEVFAEGGASAAYVIEQIGRNDIDGKRVAGSASFTALNSATLADGVLIELPDDAICDETLAIVIVGSSDTALLRAPRILLRAGRNSRLRIVEEYLSTENDLGLTNTVTNLDLAEGAEIYHHRLQREAETSAHIGRVIAEIGQNASLNSDSVAFGGALTRVDLDVALTARGARTRMHGLFTVHGEQHVDHHTTVDHQVGDTHSVELYRGILDDRSRGVFNGKVIVQRDAQGISAEQASNNLLLSRSAEIDTKPELEIYADDVKCAHGATVGELDQTALFYLRSRGVSEADARALLIYAFASEVISAIPLDDLREAIEMRFIGNTGLSEVLRGISA